MPVYIQYTFYLVLTLFLATQSFKWAQTSWLLARNPVFRHTPRMRLDLPTSEQISMLEIPCGFIDAEHTHGINILGSKLTHDSLIPGKQDLDCVQIFDVIRPDFLRRWIQHANKVKKFEVFTDNDDLLEIIAQIKTATEIHWKINQVCYPDFHYWNSVNQDFALRVATRLLNFSLSQLLQTDLETAKRIVAKTDGIEVNIPETRESIEMLTVATAEDLLFFEDYKQFDFDSYPGMIGIGHRDKLHMLEKIDKPGLDQVYVCIAAVSKEEIEAEIPRNWAIREEYDGRFWLVKRQ
jgi:hypothetical protein